MQPGNIPRGTFFAGAFCGLFLGVPLEAVAIAIVARSATLDIVFFYTAIFAGIPGLITGGGVARLVASRLAPGDRSALAIALPPSGVAGIGLGILVAVPLGPPILGAWLSMSLASAIAWLAGGAVIAVLVTLRHKRHTQSGHDSPAG